MKSDEYEDTEDQDDQEDSQEEDEQEEDSESGFVFFIQDQFQYVPWWVMSIVFHSILVCIGMLLIVEKPIKTVERRIQASLEPEKLEEPSQEETKPDPEPQTKTVNEDAPVVKDPIVKEATVSERTETANEEENQMSKGDESAMSDSPLKGQFDSSELGIGGNAGSTFGGRFGGKEDLVTRMQGSIKTEDAVRAGLLWLKRHQNPDGSWDADGFKQCCGKESEYPGTCDGPGEFWCDPGVTGLALLCFLGAGNTSKVGEFKDQVRNGLQYLCKIQDADGCFGPKEGPEAGLVMYNHAIATLAMAEAYALSNYFVILKESTQKGVQFLIKAQNPGKAWRYMPCDGDNDTSVTGWCVMALKSAKVAQIEVPSSCFQNSLNFLNLVTDNYYKTGYQEKFKNEQGEIVSGVGCPVKEKGFASSYSLTAVAMTARVFMGTERNDAYLVNGARLLLEKPPTWGQDAQGESLVDDYYWYYGTLAMFQIGGESWKRWNEALKNVLLPHQEKEGCKKGSWPTSSMWGRRGGRVYTTAINVLSLEIYYRYDKVFK